MVAVGGAIIPTPPERPPHDIAVAVANVTMRWAPSRRTTIASSMNCECYIGVKHSRRAVIHVHFVNHSRYADSTIPYQAAVPGSIAS